MNKIDREEKYSYWLDIAKYDLDTAAAMLSSGRLLYVAFMCQQAVEKLVKGLFVFYLDDDVPRVHAIRQLVKRIECFFCEPVGEKRYSLFDKLSAHYIAGRYTDYKQKLSDGLNVKQASELLEQSKEAFQWLLNMKR